MLEQVHGHAPVAGGRAPACPTRDERNPSPGIPVEGKPPIIEQLATCNTSGLTRIRRFYAARSCRHAWVLTTWLLTYVGGGVLFVVHAVIRGEQGPPTSYWVHYVLDSSLGFVLLGPILLMLIPLAIQTSGGNGLRPRNPRVLLPATIIGVLFTLVTVPGTVAHNWIAGPTTPISRGLTAVFGTDSEVVHRTVVEHSALSDALVQLVVGLPVYVALSSLALRLAMNRTSSDEREVGRRSA